MSIFSRRRLQAMLDELAPTVKAQKINEYISRIESRSTKDSLASEVELVFVWALRQAVTKLEIEPLGTDGRSRVEAIAHDMFPTTGPMAFEVRAISDDTMAGRESIVRAASLMRDYSNRIRKRSGYRLHFFFGETRERNGPWLIRKPHVDENFQLTDEIKDTLAQWLSHENWPDPKVLEFRHDNLTVNISVRDFEAQKVSAQSSIPALIQHPEKNPIFRAIERKAKRQLKFVPQGTLKCVVLVDVGCRVLTDLNPISSTGSQIRPAQVIEHARKRFNLDLAIVMSPRLPAERRLPPGWYEPIELTSHWAVTLFGDQDLLTESNIEIIRGTLEPIPAPRTDSNLARQLYAQGFFAPQSTGNYLGTSFRSEQKFGDYEVKISARMIQEYLAGRIDRKEFERKSLSFGNGNIFENSLRNGMTLSDVYLQKAGVDEDDDWICFKFSDDPAARALTSKE